MISTRPVTAALLLGNALVHTLCCGLPLLMNLVSMGALLGMAGISSHALEIHWLAAHELEVMIGSGIVLLVTAAIHYGGQYVDCRRDAGCQHEPCAPKKDRLRWVFGIECLIYLVNLGIFVFVHDLHVHSV